VSVVVY